MLFIDVKDGSDSYNLYLSLNERLDIYQQNFKGSDNLRLEFANAVSLSYADDTRIKPLVLDFTKDRMFYRLLHTSKHKEPLVRAVMTNIDSDALIFDATAGLGRDSMILHRFGANLLMFERNIVIYALLADALRRAGRNSEFIHSLGSVPKLYAHGSIDNYDGPRPAVIYYDPMFPERKKSAMVKKDMQIFKSLIGADEDVEEFLYKSIKLATRRVVLKRPKGAELICFDDIKPYSSIDGGACRFDCYRADDL